MTEVACERWSFTRGSNHWVRTRKRSFLGRWSLLMGGGGSREVLIIEHWLGIKVLSVGWSRLIRGGRLQEVLIIEHWLEKKVFWAGGRFLWEVWLYFEFKGNYAIFEFWLIFFFLFQLIISLFFVPRLFSSFCLLRKCTLSDLFTRVQGAMTEDAIMMGVMWE